MKRITIWAIFVFSVTLLSPTVVISASSKPVEVTNTPLPVTGEVTATVTGDVNITNTPAVTVVNDESEPAIVRDINSQEITPIRSTKSASAGSTGNVLYTIPSGYRLVIEYINAYINNGDFQDLFFAYGASGGILTVRYHFMPQVRLDLTRPIGVVSEQVKFWFDAEVVPIDVGFGVIAEGSNWVGEVSIFGYLVALPSS
jgi:hypothetical protein